MGYSLSRKVNVGAISEATSGTYLESIDAGSPTGAQLVYGDGANVWQADTTMVDYTPLTSSLTPKTQLPGRSLANITIASCLCPGVSTTDGTPGFDALLLACGMAKTGSTAITYKPTSTFADGSSTASVCVQYGGSAAGNHTELAAKGCFFNMDLNMTAGQAPTMNFTGQGVYIAPVNVSSSFPTSIGTVPTDTKKLVEAETLVINDGTNSLSPIARSITFSTGNTISERADLNAAAGNGALKGLAILSRQPTMTIVVEAEGQYAGNTATGDFYANLKAGTTHNISFTHSGTDSTNTTAATVAFDAPKAQLSSVSYSDDGGIRVFNLNYNLTADTSAGDDEYSFVFGVATA